MLIKKQSMYLFLSIWLNITLGIWMFVANIFFFCLGYDVLYTARIAVLFGPYLIILIPNLLGKGIKPDSKRLNAIAITMILTGVGYIIRLKINNNGSTMLYLFFWS